MSLIRQAAMDALAQRIVEALDPDVSEHAIMVENNDPDQDVCFPGVVVRTTSQWTFRTYGEEEVATSDTVQTVKIGELSGGLEIAVAAKSRHERAVLGDRILNMFAQDPLRPGVLLMHLAGVSINGQPALQPVPIAFLLGTASWQEELTFSKVRMETLELEVDIPVLVTRSPVYDITTLVTSITEDLESDSPVVEQTSINETGELEGYP